MKALIYTLGFLMATTAAWAQTDGQKPPQPNAEQREKIAKQLNLTDEQKQQMQEIRERGGSREEMQAVLTEEQRAKTKDMHAKGQNKAKHMKKALGLSDEQVAQIAKIRADGGSQEDIQAVLTDEQKAKMAAMAEKRKQKGSKKAASTPAAAPADGKLGE